MPTTKPPLPDPGRQTLIAVIRVAAILFFLIGISDLGSISAPVATIAYYELRTEGGPANPAYMAGAWRQFTAIFIGFAVYLAGSTLLWRRAPKLAHMLPQRTVEPSKADLSAGEVCIFLSGLGTVFWALSRFLLLVVPPIRYAFYRDPPPDPSMMNLFLFPTVGLIMGIFMCCQFYRIHAWIARIKP